MWSWDDALLSQQLQKSHPDWNSGDQYRSQARGNHLFGLRHPTVSSKQQQSPDDCRGLPISPCWTWSASQTHPGIEHSHCNQKTNCGHQKRREGFDSETNRQVGRPPNSVDREKRHRDPQSECQHGHGIDLAESNGSNEPDKPWALDRGRIFPGDRNSFTAAPSLTKSELYVQTA